MPSKIRLEPEQGIEAGFLAFTLGTQAAKAMEDQDISLDVMIHTFTITLGALIAQREQVRADSPINVTHEMTDACIEIMRKHAINTPTPSNN